MYLIILPLHRRWPAVANKPTSTFYEIWEVSRAPRGNRMMGQHKMPTQCSRWRLTRVPRVEDNSTIYCTIMPVGLIDLVLLLMLFLQGDQSVGSAQRKDNWTPWKESMTIHIVAISLRKTCKQLVGRSVHETSVINEESICYGQEFPW